MKIPIGRDELIAFLIAAKRRTYAAGGGGSEAVVTPLLPGSHQLEYREGSLLYRDIYFGEAYFVGQETVYAGSSPLWAMCYAGGFTTSVSNQTEANEMSLAKNCGNTRHQAACFSTMVSITGEALG